MSLASRVNVARQKHRCLTSETPASNNGKTWILHKQRISIGKSGISIRTLYKPSLFRQKYGGWGVSEKAFVPSFCHKKRQRRNRNWLNNPLFPLKKKHFLYPVGVKFPRFSFIFAAKRNKLINYGNIQKNLIETQRREPDGRKAIRHWRETPCRICGAD